MASTSQYKATSRTVRSGMLEISPTAGMKFTNNPITEGYCKTMVNMNVDTTLSVLRPRPAYEDNVLASLGEYLKINYGGESDILFSGKLYVDVWDTSNVDTVIENSEEVQALDENIIQEVYGDTSITSELRDFIVVGYGRRIINNETYYDNVGVFEVDIDHLSGAPCGATAYSDAFKGMNAETYLEQALTKNKSYVTATT